MRKQLVLMAWATGLLLTGTGCSAMVVASQQSLDRPANFAFPLGASRQEVETKLGKPVTSRALPDGGRADTYKYIIRPRADFSLTSRMSERISEWPIWLFLVLDAVSLGGTEIVFAPAVMYDVSKNRQIATFTYGPNDRLLDHGPPPPYGPADDAVGSLSLNEIREGCRSEVARDTRDLPDGVTGRLLTAPGYLYDECMVRRLAIWGIE